MACAWLHQSNATVATIAAQNGRPVTRSFARRTCPSCREQMVIVARIERERNPCAPVDAEAAEGGVIRDAIENIEIVDRRFPGSAPLNPGYSTPCSHSFFPPLLSSSGSFRSGSCAAG